MYVNTIELMLNGHVQTFISNRLFRIKQIEKNIFTIAELPPLYSTATAKRVSIFTFSF